MDKKLRYSLTFSLVFFIKLLILIVAFFIYPIVEEPLMPRSNWKGFITFGLVSIPIVLYNAIDPKSTVSFKQINRKTGSRIKYKRVDAETEKEVPWEQIGKGYELGKDTIIPVEEKDLQRVAGENARTIDIAEFIDKKNIDFVHVDKTYYLVPDKQGTKGYVILREALNAADKVGIAKVIISTKEYLAAISTYEDALVLYLLHYDDEVRKLSLFDLPKDDLKKYKVSSKEVDIAKKLIASMSGKWKPEKYKDEYKLAVEKWVSEKARDLPETLMRPRNAEAKHATKMVDFVDLLKKSLASSKRDESSSKRKTRMVPAKTKSHRRAAKVH